MINQHLKKQRGAAIIVALFVVALIAAAATIMIERLHTDIRRTELILNANKAYLYAQGSITWAIDLLNNDWQHQQANTVIDKTPVKALNHINGATVSSVLYDAQSYFNINNLTDQQYQLNFARLLQVLSPETNATDVQNLITAITDWISPGTRNPALDDYYAKLNPPYRAAHQPMTSASELRLIKGITPELYAKLSPYLIALPGSAQINVNNASIPVLMSLSMSLSPDSAKKIAAICQQNPFTSTQNFMNNDIVKNNPFDSNKITVTSNYFLLQTDVTVGQQTLTIYTMLQRAAQGTQAKTVILWQSKGTL